MTSLIFSSYFFSSYPLLFFQEHRKLSLWKLILKHCQIVNRGSRSGGIKNLSRDQSTVKNWQQNQTYLLVLNSKMSLCFLNMVAIPYQGSLLTYSNQTIIIQLHWLQTWHASERYWGSHCLCPQFGGSVWKDRKLCYCKINIRFPSVNLPEHCRKHAA